MESKHLFFLFLIVMITISCKSNNSTDQLDPDKLAIELSSDEHYLSSEEVSDIIINEDPSYLLVDVRSAEEFRQFSLPTSINVSWDEVGEENDDLDCDKYSIVF